MSGKQRKPAFTDSFLRNHGSLRTVDHHDREFHDRWGMETMAPLVTEGIRSSTIYWRQSAVVGAEAFDTNAHNAEDQRLEDP
jgi:hypothetical protein